MQIREMFQRIKVKTYPIYDRSHSLAEMWHKNIEMYITKYFN